MREFKIYEAGGMGKFGKENFKECNEWREDIKKHLISMTEDYYVNICNPNDYYSFLDDTTYDSQREIMEFDLNKVRNADLIICNFNDKYSLGTMAELAIAYERRIPVIGFTDGKLSYEELHPWQQEFISKYFTDREDMLDYILNYYLR